MPDFNPAFLSPQEEKQGTKRGALLVLNQAQNRRKRAPILAPCANDSSPKGGSLKSDNFNSLISLDVFHRLQVEQLIIHVRGASRTQGMTVSSGESMLSRNDIAVVLHAVFSDCGSTKSS